MIEPTITTQLRIEDAANLIDLASEFIGELSDEHDINLDDFSETPTELEEFLYRAKRAVDEMRLVVVDEAMYSLGMEP